MRSSAVADRPSLALRDDPALHEHHEVRVVNGHQRRQELRFRVLEVFVEDAGDVFGIEAHSGVPTVFRG